MFGSIRRERQKFTCSVDHGISYIGETSCQMFRQIANYKGTDKNSAIFEHLFDCKHCQNSDITNNFKVLNTCKKSGTVQFGADAD